MAATTPTRSNRRSPTPGRTSPEQSVLGGETRELLQQAIGELPALQAEVLVLRAHSRWVPGQFTPGMEIDHLYSRYGARAILVECSRGGFRLREPRTWIAPFHWYNPANARAVADDLACALLPFIRGDV